jgi:hypothetical protein
VNGFDVQRIAPEKTSSQRVVDVGLNRSGAVERLAEANDLTVSMNPNPKDIREFPGSQGLDCCNFHRRPLKSKEFQSRCNVRLDP